MRPRHGFTTIELLVGAAMSTIIAAAVLATWTSTHTVASRVSAHIDTDQRADLASSLLRQEVERAARAGHVGTTAGVTVDLDRYGRFGDEVVVRYASSDGSIVIRSLFASLDSARRPNLYARVPGSTRQPWVMGVERLEVTRAWLRTAGWTDDVAALVGRTETVAEVEAVEFTITWNDGRSTRLAASTVRGGLEVRGGQP